MAHPNSISHEWSIVATDKFVSATRDSGYSNTASAISELVDNSIQAGATRIRVDIEQTSTKGIEISVTDNGCGMDFFTLRQALRFGGSSRFNDRSGLGRFGMGLPNSSLSQARRVIVTSWSNLGKSGRLRKNVLGRGSPLRSYLDVDEIASGTLKEVPIPEILAKVSLVRPGRSGTIVRWESCDRLDYKRVLTIVRHVARELSQRFRYFLEQQIEIRINDATLRPIDPMFLMGETAKLRSIPYGKEMQYAISTNPNDPSADTGVVCVRFVELPVFEWAHLSNDQKRERGIVKNAGVSIIRAGREVDYGWYFFGDKRKENYDDWWRCEVSFEPVLDEAFGLTHTKQQIRPQQYLLDILSPDMEFTARTLNARARAAHGRAKQSSSKRPSEILAEARSRYLEPFGAGKRRMAKVRTRAYRIDEAPLANDCFYAFHAERGTIVLTLDPDHGFYREIYAPLRDAKGTGAKQVKTFIELLLLAAARAEAASKSEHAKVLADFRATWGRTAETFIGG